MSNKIYLIGDVHLSLGFPNNADKWFKTHKQYFESFLIPLLKEKVKPGDIIVQLGDLFDNRNIIPIHHLNYALYIVEEISRIAKQKTLIGAAAGILVGAFIGQTANTLINGYSVTGLGDVAGNGGEYYENRNGIIGGVTGSTPEGLLGRKSVKAVSSLHEKVSFLRQTAMINNSYSAYRRPDTMNEYSTRYKGVSI